MTTTATRLITLIMLLQNRPHQKATALADALGVSVRTLHRYMNMLEEMGLPIYTERGPYGGFSLVRGYKMPPLIFSPEEAVAVYLGASLVEEMWGRLYQDAARGVLAKLENLLPEEQRQEVAWARRSMAATGLHRADQERLAPTLEKLRRAARERRQVRMLYQSGSTPHPRSRELDVYALVHRWGWWYVIGYCHLRQAVRSFRVDRILELVLLEQTFAVLEDFNLRQYLASEQSSQPQIHFRLRFAPSMAHLALYNRSYWETVEEQPDDSVVVGSNAPELVWAASTALAYGPDVEVLEPPELRQMVAEWAIAIARRYDPQVRIGT
ncbi:MAG: YafY family transcriptional regulator [Anaerolineales bacterium]|nr:YafY family transcriptional regulator [Anaerolineales bacterium]